MSLPCPALGILAKDGDGTRSVYGSSSWERVRNRAWDFLLDKVYEKAVPCEVNDVINLIARS